jgi:hypothetical protein
MTTPTCITRKYTHMVMHKFNCITRTSLASIQYDEISYSCVIQRDGRNMPRDTYDHASSALKDAGSYKKPKLFFPRNLQETRTCPRLYLSLINATKFKLRYTVQNSWHHGLYPASILRPINVQCANDAYVLHFLNTKTKQCYC